MWVKLKWATVNLYPDRSKWLALSVREVRSSVYQHTLFIIPTLGWHWDSVVGLDGEPILNQFVLIYSVFWDDGKCLVVYTKKCVTFMTWTSWVDHKLSPSARLFWSKYYKNNCYTNWGCRRIYHVTLNDPMTLVMRSHWGDDELATPTWALNLAPLCQWRRNQVDSQIVYAI